MSLAIVDYGMGNIQSLYSAFKYIGCRNIIVTSKEEKLLTADRIILPGVGSFGKAIESITSSRLDSILYELVIDKGKPILGICLGMQLLGLSSSENGNNKGLGFVGTTVDSFDTSLSPVVPHMGYNQVTNSGLTRLYKDMDTVLDFYFVHSYKMKSNQNIGQSLCHYGEDFIASFELDNIAGTQFHPELSQKNGLQVLKNFVERF